MIIRHYHTMREYHERHDPRPLTHAGRKARYRLVLVAYAACLFGVALVAAWALS